MRTAPTRRSTCSWCRCRSSSAARRTSSSGWFSVLFSENWTLVGRFRRLLAILLNGRDTLVQFSPPVPPARASSPKACRPNARCASSSRVLRTHFRRIRAAVIGPDLSTAACSSTSVLRRAVGEGRHHRPGAPRQQQAAPEAWKKAHALRLGDRRRLFAPGGAFAVVPADAGLEPHLPRRAGAPPRHSSSRSRPGMKSSTCPATAATWITCC